MKQHSKLLLTLFLAACLTGCGSQPAEDTPSQPQVEESTAPILTAGESVTLDGIGEFHIEQAIITENPDYFFEADPDRTYIDFGITYRHLADTTITLDQIMDGKLIYSGQYTYSGTAVAVASDDSGAAWYYAHTEKMGPSDTREVHYFFTVPREVEDSGRMVELRMNIRNNDYRIIVREGEKGVVPGSQDSVCKTSGAIETGELIATDNAEFYVEYAAFSQKVTPPSPNSGYNYFEAEEGKILLDICVAYKNLSGKQITAGKAVSATLKQADAVASAAELGKRSSFDSPSLVNIIPLGMEYVHYIFQLPQETASGGEELTVSFKIDGHRYTYSVK